MQITKMEKIRCMYSDDHIKDIAGAVKSELSGSGIHIKSGSEIAITAGSRGVFNIKDVIKEIVLWVKGMGGRPFIIPAMGSHGGATAEGQKRVVESYGITEKYVGAPIRSSMEVVEIERGDLENRVFVDKYAYEADGIIIVNRVKVHTDFHGPTESGMMKMCVIGLGNHAQALEIHRYGLRGLKELIPKTARHVLKKTNILLGVGLVENAYDQTMAVRAVRPQNFETEEKKLLAMSRANMPRIPFDKIDLLIIDEMGKDISGVGMDTNIIGRMRIRNEEEPKRPDIANIVVLGLTDVSHGNAVGVGLADFISKRLYEKIDFAVTYENVLTSGFTERGKIPMVAPTDEQAVQWALGTCGNKKSTEVRVVRIKNTLRPDEMYISDNLLGEIKGRPDIQMMGACCIAFDENGRICEF